MSSHPHYRPRAQQNKLVSEPPIAAPDEHAQFVEADQRFCAALGQAIAAGAERIESVEATVAIEAAHETAPVGQHLPTARDLYQPKMRAGFHGGESRLLAFAAVSRPSFRPRAIPRATSSATRASNVPLAPSIEFPAARWAQLECLL